MVVRTVAFPLELTTEQECAIQETISLYSKAWNHCVDVAWGMKRVSAFDVHKQTYKKLKQDLGLKSQYLCSARNRAAEIVKAMRVLERKGKRVSKPSAAMIPIRLDARTLSFDKEMEMASIATQHGRIKIPLFWHKQALRYRGWRCQAGERCKIVLKSNRKTQSLYSCSCGLRLNADLNAARNIENLWCVANGGTFGSPVNRPIVADSFA